MCMETVGERSKKKWPNDVHSSKKHVYLIIKAYFNIIS